MLIVCILFIRRYDRCWWLVNLMVGRPTDKKQCRAKTFSITICCRHSVIEQFHKRSYGHQFASQTICVLDVDHISLKRGSDFASNISTVTLTYLSADQICRTYPIDQSDPSQRTYAYQMTSRAHDSHAPRTAVENHWKRQGRGCTPSTILPGALNSSSFFAIAE